MILAQTVEEVFADGVLMSCEPFYLLDTIPLPSAKPLGAPRRCRIYTYNWPSKAPDPLPYREVDQ